MNKKFLKKSGQDSEFGKAINMSNPFPYALWPHNAGLRKAAGNPVNPSRQVTGGSAGPSLKEAEIGHFNALATHGGHAQKVMGLSQRGVSASDPDHQIATATMMETRPAAQKALQGLQGTTLGTHLANFHQARTNLQSLVNSGGDWATLVQHVKLPLSMLMLQETMYLEKAAGNK